MRDLSDYLGATAAQGLWRSATPRREPSAATPGPRLARRRLRFCGRRLPASSQQISALGSQNFGRAPTGRTPLRASDGVRTCQLFSDRTERIEE